MFMKELWNPHDRNAVRVRTLRGEDCGFISKELNERFGKSLYFGHVHRVGHVAGSDLLGAEVKVRLELPPLALVAFPDGMSQVSVKEMFTELFTDRADDLWEMICEDVFSQARGRCAISGVEGQPLLLEQQWSFDEDRRVMCLVGLQVLCEEVYNAKHVLEERDVERRQRALWMLQAMNEWTPAEAESYLKYTLAIAAERTHGTLGWGVDLTHLRDVYGELLPEDVLIT